MSVLAICSDRRRRCGVAAAILAATLAVPHLLVAQQGITRDEALRAAFPPPLVVTRQTAYFSESQQDSVRTIAGDDAAPIPSVVTYYVAREGGGDHPVGVAYFDAHRVRTKGEVLMLVVEPDNTIRHVEVLVFQEPPEYRAPSRWLDQFAGTVLDDGLSLRGRIAPLAGATLTSRATVRATRRVLALHAIIRPFAGPRSP